MVNHVNQTDGFRGGFLYRSQGLPFSGIYLRRYHFDLPSIHTKIQGEKSALPEIVCKVEKVRSTFHTFHDYLNFCGEKKDDRLLTNFGDALYFLHCYIDIIQINESE